MSRFTQSLRMYDINDIIYAINIPYWSCLKVALFLIKFYIEKVSIIFNKQITKSFNGKWGWDEIYKFVPQISNKLINSEYFFLVSRFQRTSYIYMNFIKFQFKNLEFEIKYKLLSTYFKISKTNRNLRKTAQLVKPLLTY